MSSYTPAVTDDSFEQEVIESTIPVVVDFWASWCAPCKILAPVFEEVAEHYKDKVKFMKMDVQENYATPPKFSVLSIPTLILFKDGQVKDTRVGLISKEDLIKFIDDQI